MQEHTDTLIRMNALGYTWEEIAAQTGHKPQTVRRHGKCLGLKPTLRIDWTKRKLDE